jgi:hypothetical protein
MPRFVLIDYPTRHCTICKGPLPKAHKTGRRIGPSAYLKRLYCGEQCRKEAATNKRRLGRQAQKPIVKKAKKSVPIMIRNGYDSGYIIVHAPTNRFIASGLSHIEARKIQQALLTAAINWDFKDPEKMKESDRVQARAIIDQVLTR